MSDDLGTEEEREVHDPAAVRDDIMKRLLEYQRRQREQAAAEAANVSSVWAAPAPARTEQREVTSPPPAEEAPSRPIEEPAQDAVSSPSQPTAGAGATVDVETEIQRLQGTLDLLGSQVGELRGVFQDMAIAADERLAAIETEIARARAERGEGS